MNTTENKERARAVWTEIQRVVDRAGEPSDMTFEAALRMHLDQLERKYTVLHKLCADINLLNAESEAMLDAVHDLKTCVTRIFRLKQTWDEARQPMPRPPPEKP